MKEIENTVLFSTLAHFRFSLVDIASYQSNSPLSNMIADRYVLCKLLQYPELIEVLPEPSQSWDPVNLSMSKTSHESLITKSNIRDLIFLTTPINVMELRLTSLYLSPLQTV